MSANRFDLVIYGVTGYTGQYILKKLLESKYNGVSIAVAGRNEKKMKEVLERVGKDTGKDLSNTPVIIADTSDVATLGAMAAQAKVLINAVGPYRLHGEAVVEAAVGNGASYVDIAGEPAFIEKMAAVYGEKAKENGLYLVSACGWDSIPCDLGMNFLKKHYEGDIAYTESFVQSRSGPAGYTINDGTYQTLILGIANMRKDKLGENRKKLMPTKLPKSVHAPPHRRFIFYDENTKLWALPFMGSDKSIVVRSQYHDYVNNHVKPVVLNTYFGVSSLLRAVLTVFLFAIFGVLCQFEITRKWLQNNTDTATFGVFSKNGPTKEQVDGAGFTYWFVSKGWDSKKPVDEEHQLAPNKTIIARCDGPDMGYVATSGCVLASALTILEDQSNLPKDGGVYTSAAAFANTKVYERLEEFGITFKIDKVQ
uniref:Sacchrp_dh_NADP domain-containing protein n=1 Tax=Rhabditophanes sp. KR3021 TaxID=114890 RepID=A0AC35UEL1_9BILA